MISMKKLAIFILLVCSFSDCFSQAYIPMPSANSTWRYRIYDVDYLVQITDFILFYNGSDTVINSLTYHKVCSRACKQTGPLGFDPPIVTTQASFSDSYFGGIRESGKQVFFILGASERLIFDFNVAVGDSIPAFSGKNKVTGIDSISVGGTFHKRYLTTDSTYFVIEGVGSNRGLLPSLNDGGEDIAFFCFTDTTSDVITYSPDTSKPCTYIYPWGYSENTPIVNTADEIKIAPIPASDVLHISSSQSDLLNVEIYDCVGKKVWNTAFCEKLDVPVSCWSKGLYFLRIDDKENGTIVKKVIIE